MTRDEVEAIVMVALTAERTRLARILRAEQDEQQKQGRNDLSVMLRRIIYDVEECNDQGEIPPWCGPR